MVLAEMLREVRELSPMDREILRRVMDAGIVVKDRGLTKAEALSAIQQARESIAHDLGIPIKDIPESEELKEEA